MKTEVLKYRFQEFKRFLESHGDKHKAFIEEIDHLLSSQLFKNIEPKPPVNLFTRFFKS